MKRPSSKKLPAEKLQQQRLTRLAKAPKQLTKRDLESSLVGRMISTRRARRIAASISAFALSVLLAITAVATFSPLLAISEIYVTGTERIKQEQIAKALAPHIGTPLPLLSEQEVAASLSSFDLIESFSATAVPPNGLKVRIFERQPISMVKSSGVAWLHDPAGIRIDRAKPGDVYPEVVISEDPRSSQRYRNAMEVLMALPENLLDEVETIEAKTKDDVQLTLRSSRGQKIIWGDSSNAVLKSKVLQALMKNNRRATDVTFDVSSPNAPVVRFGNF